MAAAFHETADPLQSRLRQEKANLIACHPHLSRDAIEDLWLKQLSFTLSFHPTLKPSPDPAALPTTSPTEYRGTQPYPRPQEPLGRTHSIGATPSMVRQSSGRRERKERTRSRANSQQSAPAALPMSRNSSIVSSSSGMVAASDSTTRRPIAIPFGRSVNDELVSRWSKDAPYAALRSPQSFRRPVATAYPALPEMREFGEDAQEYLARHSSDQQPLVAPSVMVSHSPGNAPYLHRSRHDPRRLSASAGVSTSFDSNLSDPNHWADSQSTNGLTNSTTPTSNSMSRQDSDMGMCDAINMMTVDSSQGFYPGVDALPADPYYPSAFENPEQAAAPYDDRGSHAVRGTGGVAELSQQGAYDHSSALTSLGAPEMQRNDSNASNGSTSSTQSAARRRQQHLANARRPIMPKSSNDQSSQLLQRSSNGRQGRIAIPKTQHKRKATPRLHCSDCLPKVKTFKGDHELRRHKEREHGATMRRWISVDMSPNRDFLAKCSKCQAQKRYGAAYNCAAHLRRAHFNPAPKGEEKRKAQTGPKRGGSGGGSYPTLDQLKTGGWLKEVVLSGTAAADELRAEDANEDEEAETELELVEDQHSHDTVAMEHTSSVESYPANDDDFDHQLMPLSHLPPDSSQNEPFPRFGNDDIENANMFLATTAPADSAPDTSTYLAGSLFGGNGDGFADTGIFAGGAQALLDPYFDFSQMNAPSFIDSSSSFHVSSYDEDMSKQAGHDYAHLL